MGEANEIFESLKEYLPDFIKGVSSVGFELRKTSSINFEEISHISTGIEWIHQALCKTEKLHGLTPDEYDFKKILSKIEIGLTQTDEIFLSDILEYDILETIGDIYEKIQNENFCRR